jgi:hypothetical protein
MSLQLPFADVAIRTEVFEFEDIPFPLGAHVILLLLWVVHQIRYNVEPV